MGVFGFLEKIPTLNEINGSFGEWLAKVYSKTMPGVLVLHDILINGASGHTSQIDLLLIGNKGIYVVEMKMYTNARIYGDTRKAKWNYYSHGGKYEIYSPIKQNQKHVEFLKAFLKDYGDVPCFSVVAVICEDFKVSSDMPKDTVLCNSLPAMERAIYQIAGQKPEIWSEEQKKAIYEYIKDHQIVGREARREHKESVQLYQKKLEQIEREKKCPYCQRDLVLRKGKYGEFYGCPNYPKCKYTLK